MRHVDALARGLAIPNVETHCARERRGEERERERHFLHLNSHGKLNLEIARYFVKHVLE